MVDNFPEIPGYEIKRVLEDGMTNTIYEALATASDSTVALKVLKRSEITDIRSLERIRREIRVLSELDHPGIRRILNRGEDRGQVWIAMEFLVHRPLREKESGGPLGQKFSAESVFRLAKDCLSALDELHSRNILHRNIKPENVFARPDGSHVLGGLDLAKDPESSAMALSGTGWFLGSMAYAPPELYRNEPISFPGDIFSLGLVLFEALTGCHPSDMEPVGPDFECPQIPAALPPAERLPGLVRQMLKADPKARPASPAVILESLS